MWPSTLAPDLMRYVTNCPAGTVYLAGGYCVPIQRGTQTAGFPSINETVNVTAGFCNQGELNILGGCVSPLLLAAAAGLVLLLVVGK